MKILVNNQDKRIRITAPEIEFKPKYINGLCWDYDAYEIGREMTVYAKDWTLIEEKENTSWAEKLKAEIKRLEEMDYPCDTLEQSAGFYDALDRIKSFIDSLVEEQPATKSKEIKSKLISAVKAQFYPGPEKDQIIQWIQNANL